MGYLKAIVGKLVAGVLYGAGFGVGLFLIANFVLVPFIETEMENMETEITEMGSPFIEFDENAKLDAVVKTENIGNGKFVLLGELSNNGEHAWSGIKLKADIFDASGKFIDQCEEYVNDTVKPAKTINFKMSCGKCTAVQLGTYDSYKLYVADAYHVEWLDK